MCFPDIFHSQSFVKEIERLRMPGVNNTSLAMRKLDLLNASQKRSQMIPVTLTGQMPSRLFTKQHHKNTFIVT